jgi:50S ribosomal protein L16 3-hydroxylase
MRRHWQKKPLLIRQAVANVQPPLTPSELFSLAAGEDVESRLVECLSASGEATSTQWRMRTGPFTRRQLPPLQRPGWTLLVQGLDLHVQAAHDLLSQFRFIPDARLDDVMVSYASDGGGVGPHFDSYDVFLLQVHGRRRWRIGRMGSATLRDDVPLKILAEFEPEEEFVLEPGDMLYLPPRWAHDGVAEGGACMTCSIGFRAATRAEMAQQVLQRVLDALDDHESAPTGAELPAGEGGGSMERLYRDPAQQATVEPARVPEALEAFARDAVQRLLDEPGLLQQALGEWLSEPKPATWFEAGASTGRSGAIRLDRRTRMLYDRDRIFINGESFDAAGRDARLMRCLADTRRLAPKECAMLSEGANTLLRAWLQAGWVRED